MRYSTIMGPLSQMIIQDINKWCLWRRMFMTSKIFVHNINPPFNRIIIIKFKHVVSIFYRYTAIMKNYCNRESNYKTIPLQLYWLEIWYNWWIMGWTWWLQIQYRCISKPLNMEEWNYQGGYFPQAEQHTLSNGGWVYPPLEDAMTESGLQEVET